MLPKEPSPAVRYKRALINKFANAVGIDLGTVNTVGAFYGKTPEIFHNESSLVALNTRTNRIEAVGNIARAMLGRTPKHIEIIRPIQEGVVADFEVTEQLLFFLLKKLTRVSSKILGPTVVIGVPPSATDIDINTLKKATRRAGVREAYIVHEPLAALISLVGSSGSENTSLVIDVGGGTTDILILSQNKSIVQKSIPIAGCTLDTELFESLKVNENIIVGERTVEDLKIKALSDQTEQDQSFIIRGKHTVSRLPSEVTLKRDMLSSYIQEIKNYIVSFSQETLSSVDPDLSIDLLDGGAYLVGGGAFLYDLKKELEDAMKIPITVAPDPFVAVARGAAIIANQPEQFAEFFLCSDGESKKSFNKK